MNKTALLKIQLLLALSLAISVNTAIAADPTEVTHTFKSGEPALASQVNTNFSDLAKAIDEKVGATWLSGTEAPTNEEGVDGDLYLNTTDSQVYKKEAGAWVASVNIKGLQGEQGIQGPVSTVAGPTGPTGPVSTVAGPEGPTGPVSTVAGPEGPTGPTGPVSTVAGPEGPVSTVAGPTGATGPQGPAAHIALVPPTVNDDVNSPYTVGSIWFDNTQKVAYMLLDDTANAAVWSLLSPPNHVHYEIGDTGPAGGIVFHVTDGGLHGLEAAPVDQTTGVSWCSSNTDIVGVDNIGSAGIPDSHSGADNTPLIEAVCGVTSAAGLAANYAWPNTQTGGFLPNKEELNLLYAQKDVVGGFTNGSYWSSTEFDSNKPWYQFFTNGIQSNGFFKINLVRVRAVRAF